MSETKDSNQIRARLSIAQKGVDQGMMRDLDEAKAHALLAIGHALVNISDDLSRILDTLSDIRGNLGGGA